jgi:hypothetical protein
MSAYFRAVSAYAAAVGGERVRIVQPAGRSHPQLHFCRDGRDYRVSVGSTPSDTNAIWMARRYIRHALGLFGRRPSSPGRGDRVRHACRRLPPRPEPPVRLVQIAAPMPDWHDQLRRHPAYLAFFGAGRAS